MHQEAAAGTVPGSSPCAFCVAPPVRGLEPRNNECSSGKVLFQDFPSTVSRRRQSNCFSPKFTHEEIRVLLKVTWNQKRPRILSVPRNVILFMML